MQRLVFLTPIVIGKNLIVRTFDKDFLIETHDGKDSAKNGMNFHNESSDYQTEESCSLENGYAFYSNTIPGGVIKSATMKTPYKCRKVCTETSRCKYFTWFARRRVRRRTSYYCLLQVSNTWQIKRRGFVSGSACRVDNSATVSKTTTTPTLTTTTTASSSTTKSSASVTQNCKYPPDHSIHKTPSEECKRNTKVTGFTEAGKSLIVETHNELRQKVASGQEPNQPSASNMRKLVWNDEIASIAQKMVESCSSSHDSAHQRATCDKIPVGQNIFWQTYSSPKSQNRIMALMDRPVRLWYDEVEQFDKAKINSWSWGGGTGHYSQVVWANTYAVGCGISTTEIDNVPQTTVVCNYLPNGNTVGASIYKIGEGCSACPKNMSCDLTYDKMCS